MMKNSDNPIILDIEASGFGKGSYPIEVGFALPDKSTFCSLIIPLQSWTHWSLGAQEVHGISRETLMQRGHPVEEVAEQLNYFLGDKTVYSDGWGYDMSWVSLLYEAAGMPMKFKIETLHTLLHEEQLLLWEKTRIEVIKDLGIQRHRASSDARIIQETFIRTRNKLSNQSA